LFLHHQQVVSNFKKPDADPSWLLAGNDQISQPAASALHFLSTPIFKVQQFRAVCAHPNKTSLAEKASLW